MYIWPEGSPANKVIDSDLFHLLDMDTLEFESLSKIFVVCDFNGRVANKSDYVMYDRAIDGIDVDYISDDNLSRESQDSVTNSYGLKLLDLCRSSSLRIANGRLESDYGLGLETLLKRHERSVIDYLLVRECDFSNVLEFCIKPFCCI